jgi:hypothetical protein
MSARLAENKVISDLEHLLHAAKHPESEERLQKLDDAYRRRLQVLLLYGTPGTVARYAGFGERYFHNNGVAR